MKALEITTDGGDDLEPAGAAPPNYLGANGNYANAVAIDPTNPHVFYAAGSVDAATAPTRSSRAPTAASPGPTSPSTARGPSPTPAQPRPGVRRLRPAPRRQRRRDLAAPGRRPGLVPLGQHQRRPGDHPVQLRRARPDERPTSPTAAPRRRASRSSTTTPSGSMILRRRNGGNVAVDPTNPQTVYYESTGISLDRSVNGGTSGAPTIGRDHRRRPDRHLRPVRHRPVEPQPPPLRHQPGLHVDRPGDRPGPRLRPPAQTASTTPRRSVSIAIAATDPNTIYAVDAATPRSSSAPTAATTWTEHDIPDGDRHDQPDRRRPGERADRLRRPQRLQRAASTPATSSRPSTAARPGPTSAATCPTCPPGRSPSTTVANQLYVGTDTGVFASTDGGTTWAPFKTGLPNAAGRQPPVQPERSTS